jgi:hypothetical protein
MVVYYHQLTVRTVANTTPDDGRLRESVRTRDSWEPGW